jgi:hypothetical protein
MRNFKKETNEKRDIRIGELSVLFSVLIKHIYEKFLKVHKRENF